MSVNLGSIWWSVEVANAAQAADKAHRMQEELGNTAEQANRANRQTEQAGRGMGKYERETDSAADTTSRFRGVIGLLSTAFFFLIGKMAQAAGVSGMLSTALTGGGIAAAAGTAAGAIKGLAAWLGGALAGAAGTVAAKLSGFVSWLLAGSAGALAAAAGIGALIGLFATWILEVTGVLDAVKALGSWVANTLPNWVKDAVLAIIGLFAGPLAVIGGFIVGFIEGGFDEAFARASRIIQIFFGAFKRTFDRVLGILKDAWGWLTDMAGKAWDFTLNLLGGAAEALGDAWSDLQNIVGDTWSTTLNILGGAKSYVEDVLSSLQDIAAQTWNTVIDIAMQIPGVSETQQVVEDTNQQVTEDTGGTSLWDAFQFGINPGGAALSFLEGGMASGGVVTGPTPALVGEGSEPEAVMPLSDLDQMLANAGSGGGGGDVVIDGINIEIGDQSLDLRRLSRSDVRRLADELAPELGREVEKIISNP